MSQPLGAGCQQGIRHISYRAISRQLGTIQDSTTLWLIKTRVLSGHIEVTPNNFGVGEGEGEGFSEEGP